MDKSNGTKESGVKLRLKSSIFMFNFKPSNVPNSLSTYLPNPDPDTPSLHLSNCWSQNWFFIFNLLHYGAILCTGIQKLNRTLYLDAHMTFPFSPTNLFIYSRFFSSFFLPPPQSLSPYAFLSPLSLLLQWLDVPGWNDTQRVLSLIKFSFLIKFQP